MRTSYLLILLSITVLLSGCVAATSNKNLGKGIKESQ